MGNYKLTGKFYHRKTFLGQVLYVEIVDRVTGGTPNGRLTVNQTRYKKASQEDAAELIRWFNMLVVEHGIRSNS